MKKIIKSAAFVAAAFLGMSVALTSCKDNNDNNGTENPQEDQYVVDNVIGDGSERFEINGDVTLEKGTYELRGFVYVTDGNTLTIPAGTIIKGDQFTKATLIIERGGKIMAQGTASEPIVFTSEKAPGERSPGDWGGLIILGRATNNQGEMTIEGGVSSNHGGTDDADNSGILSYVRVEFGGIEYSTDNEINGITLGSVGSGTKIDHVQVSYAKDDSFEWFGGTVNATHLVALGTWDDTFDADNGYSGKLQFLFGLNDPEYADKSASNGFETDNNSSASTAEPFTSAVFSNVTIVGPVSDPTNYTDKGSEHGSGFFQNAIQIRRNSRLSLFNSVVMGYPIGLNVDNDKSSSTQEAALERGALGGNVMAGMVHNFSDSATNNSDVFPEGTSTSVVEAIWNKAGEGNVSPLATIAALNLQGDPQNLIAPNAIPSASSVAATSAVWTNSLVASGFEQVDYSGAFAPTESASSNWMTGWTNFDPQNTVY